MKAVPLERDLDMKDKQKAMLKSSIKGAKKKLQEYEVTLQLNRGKVEKGGILDQILTKNRPQKFPSMSKLQNDYKLKNPRPIRLSTGEVVLTRVEQEELERERKSRVVPVEALAKLEEVRKNKTFGVTSYFGGKVEGESLKTIKNYKGMNQYERGARTLTRKGPWFPHYNTSSIPRWFCPGYYDYDDQVIKPKKVTPNLEKQVWRNPKTSEEFKQERMEIAKRNEEYFRRVQERNGKLVEPPRYATPSVCSRPHSNEEASLMSITSPFSVLSAESTMGLPHPSSRAKSPSNVHMRRRISKDMDNAKVQDGMEEELSQLDRARHDNKFYFTPNAGVATAMLDERDGRGPGFKLPKDYTYGALTLQRNIHEDDESTVSTVLSRDTKGSKSTKGTHRSEASDKEAVLKASTEANTKGVAERDVPIEAEEDARDEPKDDSDQLEGRHLPSINLGQLDTADDLSDYIRTWKKDAGVYLPLKPKLSRHFARPVPESPNGGRSPTKIVAPFPDYLLMTEKDAVVNGEIMTTAKEYEPPDTARTEPDPEILREEYEHAREQEELDKEFEEWEEVIGAQAAASAFLSNINFG